MKPFKYLRIIAAPYPALLHGLLWGLCIGGALASGSCRKQQKPQTVAIEQDTLPADIPLSTFNLPVHFDLKQFEAFINLKITGEFLRAEVYPTQNARDVVHIVLRKYADIRIVTDGDELVCTIPIHVAADVIKSRFNLLTKSIKPLDAYAAIELRTKANLDANWHLVTHLKLNNIRWIKPPVLDAGLLKFDLTRKLNDYITEHEDELTRMLDQKINQAVSLEKPMGKIWHDLQRPICIYKIAPQAWLKIHCESISGNFVLKPDEIICYTSIEAHVTIVTDTTDVDEKTSLPAFEKNNNEVSDSDIRIFAYSSFEEINHHLRRFLTGKQFDASGMQVTIEDLSAFSTDSMLNVLLKTSGSIVGDLIVTGIPVFDSLSQSISVEQFNFLLTSTSSLLYTGDILLHDMIRDSVRSVLFFGMDSLIQALPNVIEQAIGKGKKTGDWIEVDVQHLYVYNCDILLSRRNIYFNIRTALGASILLKKLESRKKMMISPRPKPPLPHSKRLKKAE